MDYDGGIAVGGTASLRMENCAITDNTAVVGGGGLGVFSSATAPLINCTVHINTAGNEGGGINPSGDRVTLIHCTVTGNSAGPGTGGGISNELCTLHLENCIIAGNSAAGDKDLHDNGTLTRAGYNFIGSNTSIETLFPAGNPNPNGDRASTAAAPLDPQLSAFNDNGGPVRTRQPLPGSPVINNGLATAGTPVSDARGAARVQGSDVDLGAVEVEWNANLTGSGPSLTGLWFFDDSTNLNRTAVGTSLTIVGTPPAWSTNQADDNGQVLSGVITTRSGAGNRLLATHDIAPNGGGSRVNRYTILMDVLSPAASRSEWRAVFKATALTIKATASQSTTPTTKSPPTTSSVPPVPAASATAPPSIPSCGTASSSPLAPASPSRPGSMTASITPTSRAALMDA